LCAPAKQPTRPFQIDSEPLQQQDACQSSGTRNSLKSLQLGIDTASRWLHPKAASAAIIGMLLLGACAAVGVHTQIRPGAAERYCAWFGDVRGETLYFGQAAFWSAFRAPGGAPASDLDREGPALIGRFDLAREQLLEPLDVSAGGDRSGVWDVLAHANGRVYFTSYFESAGWVDPHDGATRRLAALGVGLNELAHGPDGSLLVSRYVEAGSVVVFDAEGALLAEHPLTPPPGFSAVPKTVAFDPSRREIWVTTDLLPHAEAAAPATGPKSRAARSRCASCHRRPPTRVADVSSASTTTSLRSWTSYRTSSCIRTGAPSSRAGADQSTSSDRRGGFAPSSSPRSRRAGSTTRRRSATAGSAPRTAATSRWSAGTCPELRSRRVRRAPPTSP
jgi:hypothetical protein